MKITAKHAHDSQNYRLFQWQSPGKLHGLYLPKNFVSSTIMELTFIKVYQHQALVHPDEVERLKAENEELRRRLNTIRNLA